MKLPQVHIAVNVAGLTAAIGSAATWALGAGAGGVAASPAIEVGTDSGKPLYARLQFSTDRTFSAAAPPAALTSAAVQDAVQKTVTEAAAIHDAATSAHVESAPAAGTSGPFA